jgi:hypothetical protein
MIPGANFKMKSGISWWIFGPVLGLFMVTGYLTVRDSTFMLALYIPLTAFILSIIFNTHYTITSDGKLKVFCGIFPFPKIEISDITHFKYTSNPISSPAASLKRLALYHNGRILVIISPENRDLFVEVLEQHNTSLQQK